MSAYFLSVPHSLFLFVGLSSDFVYDYCPHSFDRPSTRFGPLRNTDELSLILTLRQNTNTNKLHYNSEQEYKRMQESSNMDDGAQHVMYAHPFTRSVVASVASVMCS